MLWQCLSGHLIRISVRRSSDNPPSQGCQSDNSKKTLVSIFADVAFRKCLVMEFFGRHQRKSRHIFKAFFVWIQLLKLLEQQLLTEKNLKKRNVQWNDWWRSQPGKLEVHVLSLKILKNENRWRPGISTTTGEIPWFQILRACRSGTMWFQ